MSSVLVLEALAASAGFDLNTQVLDASSLLNNVTSQGQVQNGRANSDFKVFKV